MTVPNLPHFILSADVKRAWGLSLPIVALESTVITHGLPHPQNLTLANDMEAEVRNQGATPATVAVLDGEIHVGLTPAELERLAYACRDQNANLNKQELKRIIQQRGGLDPSRGENQIRKISRRDFATAIMKKECGGTTVAGTLFAAHQVGIKVFATGGIGGVHEIESLDISTDLAALADTPMIVVCAGAKAILDLPATLEYLETAGVPVVGYQTSEFPAFYSRESGLPVSARLNSPEEVVEFARANWEIGMKNAVLVCQPIPVSDALPRDRMNEHIQRARQEARKKDLHGQAVTPYLLQRLVELTEGASLRANLALLLNNARLAALIARAYSAFQRQKIA